MVPSPDPVTDKAVVRDIVDMTEDDELVPLLSKGRSEYKKKIYHQFVFILKRTPFSYIYIYMIREVIEMEWKFL